MSDLKIQSKSTEASVAHHDEASGAPPGASVASPDEASGAPPGATPDVPPSDAEETDHGSNSEGGPAVEGRQPKAAAPEPAPPERPVAVNDLTDEQLQAAYSASVVAIEEGTIISGKVVRIDTEEVMLDVGFKSEGVIPVRELSIRHDAVPADIVEMGEEVEALVQKKEDSEGRLILSKKRAQYERAWGNVEQIRTEGGSVSGTVIEVVKGGLIVDIGLRGFLPASLVDLRRVRDLSSFVGTKIKARVLELDKNRNNVVLSRRAWLEDEQKEQRGVFLDQLKPGEVRDGVVSSVVPFGAFVDIGGMDGLVHVSELSWRHLDDPSSLFAPGDEVRVKVLEVDIERERISLSIKGTQPDPWEEFVSTHRVGELVYGRITKLVPFGAFVQVGENIEGLVHISEVSPHHVEVLEQVVTPGEEMWVKIINIDVERRRMSLSVKQAAEGGVVSAEYQEHFGDHAFDEEGNYLGAVTDETIEAGDGPAVGGAAGDGPVSDGAGGDGGEFAPDEGSATDESASGGQSAEEAQATHSEEEAAHSEESGAEVAYAETAEAEFAGHEPAGHEGEVEAEVSEAEAAGGGEHPAGAEPASEQRDSVGSSQDEVKGEA